MRYCDFSASESSPGLSTLGGFQAPALQTSHCSPTHIMGTLPLQVPLPHVGSLSREQFKGVSQDGVFLCSLKKISLAWLSGNCFAGRNAPSTAQTFSRGEFHFCVCCEEKKKIMKFFFSSYCDFTCEKLWYVFGSGCFNYNFRHNSDLKKGQPVCFSLPYAV